MILCRAMNFEELLDAVRKGETEIVRACMSSNILPCEKEWKGGYKFLNLALAYKEYEVARILLERATKVNNETERPERTPLHYAATDNKIDLMKQLLEKGADPNAIDEHDMTPLHYGVILENLDSVELLLDHGADADEVTDHVFRFTPYQHACKSGRYEILESFLNHGSNANDMFEQPDNLICPKGSTPLHMAVTQKNLDAISLLLDRDADVNHMNDNKETCLHVACRENSEEIVRLLIDKKALVDVKSKDNTTPLHIAVRNGNVEIVQMLLDNGASIENQDKDGKIPLQLAVEERRTKIVQLLLDNESGTENQDKNGEIPLQGANGKRHTKIANCLQKRNIDVNSEANRKAFKKALLESGLRSEIFKCFVKQGFVLTPIEISEVFFEAIAKGYFHVVETLLEFISETEDVHDLIGMCNEEGDTLLHSATKNRQHDIVRLLIRKKADVQALNIIGNLPIFYAIDNDDENMVKTFITEGSGIKNYPLLVHTVIQIKREKSRRLLDLVLRDGADVNQRDEDLEGSTALHLICREAMKNDVDLAEILLRHGADINATTNLGSTVLHMSAVGDSEAMVEALLRFDPQIDARDQCGNTPLHLASAKARYKIISILLDSGASVNVEDNLGMTAVDVAFSVKNGLPKRLPGQPADEDTVKFEADVNKTVALFQQHVIKLSVANLHLNKSNKKYLTEDQEHYKSTCEKELSDIKHQSINSYVTLYDILMRNVKKVVRYTREDNAKTSLEYVEYKTRYPIYGSLIDNVKKDVMREYVLNKAKDAINFLTGYGLPDSCTENIFLYLRTKELKNVSIATTIHVDKKTKSY